MIDRKILNFEKKIKKFSEYHLGKARIASKESTEDFQRALYRAEKELKSLYNKLEKLKEKFSPDELSGVEQLIEENRQEYRVLKKIYSENNFEESTSKQVDTVEEPKLQETVNSSLSDERTNEFSKKEKDKKIVKFERNLKNLESFELKNVRKYNNISDLKPYLKEIYSANKKLKRIKEKFASLQSEFEADELKDVSKILADYQDELLQHENNAQKFQERVDYLTSRTRPFSLITYFFSDTPEKHSTPTSIVETALNNGFTYTFNDSQTLLEIEEYGSNYKLKLGQQDYKKSIDNLNDNKYIEAFYLYLDQLIEYDNEKEKTLSILYQAISIIKDTLFPDFDILDDILFYINKLKSQRSDLKEEQLKDIIISDFHANNINKLFFTSQETKPVEKLTQSDMKTEFFPGETIRCIAFLDNTYKNIYGKNNRPTFEFVGDFRKQISEGFYLEDAEKGYIDFKLVTNGKDYIFPSHARWSSVEKVMHFFTQLPPRKKSIEVKIDAEHFINGEFPVAELVSSFRIDGSNVEGIEMLKKNIKIVQNQVLANVPIPESKMHNEKFEEEILTLFKNLGWKENFKRVIITSDDFFALKNQEKISVARGLNVSLLSESDNGCYMQHFLIAQDPIGEKWSKFRLEARGDKIQISCSKI